MNLFKKIFNPRKEVVESSYIEKTTNVKDLSLDDIFVHNFIKKGGRFLYCTSLEEANQYLLNIIEENNWQEVSCIDTDLIKLLNVIKVKSTEKMLPSGSFFTLCEQLISDTGSVMFSSNQIQQHKIPKLPNNFIVLARTSQIVRSTSESLMAVRKNYVHDFPTNISSIKNYIPGKADEDFLSYGNSNAKNLYLLLLEDL